MLNRLKAEAAGIAVVTQQLSLVRRTPGVSAESGFSAIDLVPH